MILPAGDAEVTVDPSDPLDYDSDDLGGLV